jgi:uncharacterized protein (DUF2384 family)
VNEENLEDLLRKAFPGKAGRINWMKNHNLLLGGERPETLIESEEGLGLVLNELKKMTGEDRGLIL